MVEKQMPIIQADIVDTMNYEYAELVENIFGQVTVEPIIYTEETHTRIKSLRHSISEELERRFSGAGAGAGLNPEEKRRSWRFQSIDSEYRLQLFHGYIDDAVKVEPVLLRDPSLNRILTLDIIE